MIKLTNFQILHFVEGTKPVILLYGLGEDGIVYEMSGGRWAALPVEEGKLRDLQEEAKLRTLQQQEQSKHVNRINDV